ncbi:MAG: SusF/SusE family outer membrane protein [Muribaculaceae bacterium]|nr:SusF/SusE family outer membrane protein [Muribaculaceae bacterium]
MKQFYKSLSLLLLGFFMSPEVSGSVTIIDYIYHQCDVNRDGAVTASDVTAIYDYLLGNTSGSNIYFDTNHDGTVTSADVTMVYDVLLNGTAYNSISDAFELNLECLDIDRAEYHDGYLFYWDDVATENGMSSPDYMLLLSTNPAFIDYYCVHASTNEYYFDNKTITEGLRSKLHWYSPEDVADHVPLYARVELVLDNYVDVLISNELEFDFVPRVEFSSCSPIHLWWLIGSFVGTNHWDNNYPVYGGFGRVPLYPVQGATYNSDGDGLLEYYGYFPAGGEFKILEEAGYWDNVIGGGDENGGQVYSGNTGNYPDNIHINQGGYYKISLNTVSKTMTMTHLADNQASYSSITMPGEYQGWDVTGNAMTALAQTDNHDWFAYLNLDSASELKFAAGIWDHNWGIAEFPYGKGVIDGPNIPAQAGSYCVYFNDLSGDYMFIDEENGLPSAYSLIINENFTGDYLDLTLDYENDTRFKLCDIMTELDGPMQLLFNSTSVPIELDGTVDLNEFKYAVLSTYRRPLVGGAMLNCAVEANAGNVSIKSNTISIPVQVENYNIVIKDSGESIPMERIGISCFDASIPATDGDIMFNIYPESEVGSTSAITPMPDGDNTATDGTFVYTNPSGYFTIPYQAEYMAYKIILDFGYKTYSIEGIETSSMLWQVGNANDWGSGSPASGLSRNYDGNYTGYMYLNGDFRFRENKTNWDGKNWGQGASAGTLMENGNNLYAPAGFYKVDVDIPNLYYNLTTISSVSIIGSAVPTGYEWSTDLDLTYNQNTGAWEGIYVLNEGEYKIRANHDWFLNWGGTDDNLVPNGANLTIAQPGPYLVQVYLTYNGDSHVTLTRQ